MRLLVVRHGRTRSNAEGRYQGSIDTDLDEVGLDQARALATQLPGDVEVVVSSPLRRARQTAEAFCAARGLPLTFEPAFRERSLGVFEGLTAAEVRERHPELHSRRVTQLWDDAPPGGESIGAVFERVAAGLHALREAHAGRRVLLVAHGYVSRVIRATCLGRVDDFHAWMLGNGALLEVEIPDDAIRRPAVLGPALVPALGRAHAPAIV
jgi:probable phosphoglycerate mutase